MKRIFRFLRLKRVWIPLVFVVLPFLWFFPFIGMNYRLTLHVDTPQGVMKASVVQREFQHMEPRILPESGGKFVSVKGEALVMKIGDHYLFALLRQGILSGSFLEPPFSGTGRSSGYAINAPEFFWHFGVLKYFTWRTAELPRKFYPKLVMFGDVSDPSSVALVDPDDLAASFGDGYALKKVTIHVTHKPVTKGMAEGVLGWLKQQIPNRLDGSRFEFLRAENSFANSISPFSFSTELNR